MARAFNGTTSLLAAGDVADIDSTTYTLMCWLYTDLLGESDFPRIIDKDNNTDTGYLFFFDEPNRAVYFGANGVSVSSTTLVITADTWHHVAVSCNGSNASFYVDSVAQGSPAFTQNPGVTTEVLRFGNIATQDRTMSGRLAEVLIYPTLALSQDEIRQSRWASLHGRYGQLPRYTAIGGHWPLLGQEAVEPGYVGGALVSTLPATVTDAPIAPHPVGYQLPVRRRRSRGTVAAATEIGLMASRQLCVFP